MKFSQPQGNVPGVLFNAFFGEIDPVLMWLNAFFALQLIGELNVNCEAWKDSIFELVVLGVLIAIVWVVLSL